MLCWEASTYAEPLKVGLAYASADGAADLSLNWMANEGLLRAVTDLGVVGTTYTPTTEADYDALLNQCVDDGNALCLSAGFQMADATWNSAAAHPDVDFAIVDFAWEAELDNLRGIIFSVEEAGYLAGTLAGLMTNSDVVGGVGGMEIPAVSAFLEPYRNGARWVNPDVEVIITYTDTFVDPDLGAQVAQELMANGADVIFGVAGPTGDGAILEAAQSGAWEIGVDADSWHTVFESGAAAGSDRLLTSAMKRVDSAVYHTIADEVDGVFTSGSMLYDVAVDGVGLAPFHDSDPSIPQAARDALAEVQMGILNGSIDVWAPYQSARVFLPVTWGSRLVR